MLNRLPPPPCLLLVDEASVEIRINRHLFAGHSVKGKTRRHFRNAPGPLGDDHKVDHDQDAKDDDTDHKIAADDKITEGLDDGSSSVWTLVAV